MSMTHSFTPFLVIALIAVVALVVLLFFWRPDK
jgi:hypothetical protein